MADGPQARARVEEEVRAAVHQLPARLSDRAACHAVARRVLLRIRPATPRTVHQVASGVLAAQVDRVLGGGWPPADLVELVTRGADPTHVPVLRTALHEEARRNHGRGQAWLAALARLGGDPRAALHDETGLASVLVITSLLLRVPLLTAEALVEDPGTRADEATAHPKLARVRALLAKAESTTFPEEAESLSAKAQELIARYSLEEMIARHRNAAGTVGALDPRLMTRRVWLDPPYLGAKAHLVAAVASANHARCASNDTFGYVVLVGARHDLDAVELLVTSLLVQADRAMLAHGRQADGIGVSRTRSFRRSFLIAYGDRIGQRLRSAVEDEATAQGSDLLPVLADHDERVAAAFEAMVPHRRGRARRVSSYEGWVAGVAAADVAQLGVRGQVDGGA